MLAWSTIFMYLFFCFWCSCEGREFFSRAYVEVAIGQVGFGVGLSMMGNKYMSNLNPIHLLIWLKMSTWTEPGSQNSQHEPLISSWIRVGLAAPSFFSWDGWIRVREGWLFEREIALDLSSTPLLVWSEKAMRAQHENNKGLPES